MRTAPAATAGSAIEPGHDRENKGAHLNCEGRLRTIVTAYLRDGQRSQRDSHARGSKGAHLTRSNTFCRLNCSAMLRPRLTNVSKAHAKCGRQTRRTCCSSAGGRRAPPAAPSAGTGRSSTGRCGSGPCLGRLSVSSCRRNEGRRAVHGAPVNSSASFQGGPRWPSGGAPTKNASTAGTRVTTSDLRCLVRNRRCGCRARHDAQDAPRPSADKSDALLQQGHRERAQQTRHDPYAAHARDKGVVVPVALEVREHRALEAGPPRARQVSWSCRARRGKVTAHERTVR